MFTFEHTYTLTESEFVELWSLRYSKRPRVYARRVAIVVVAVVCLFSSFTLLLGLLVLAFAALGLFLPHIVPWSMARRFRDLRYLSGPVTYGADNESVWVRTPDLVAKAGWRHLTTWRERGGWLVLHGYGFPTVLLPIAGLQTAGAYDEIKLLVEQHATEFGSRKAQRPAHSEKARP